MAVPEKESGDRKTIGVLLAQVSRVWGAEFMAGVDEAAQENDLNIVCFVGGKPKRIVTPGQIRPSYGLYDLIKPGEFDGLLLAADLAHSLTQKEINDFCKSFAPTPMVAHAIEANGVPHLIANNLNGMREVIRHLIEVHDYKRIAFIKGVEGQLEAELRFQAYQEELEAHDIPFRKRLVVQGDFTPESGRAAIKTLIDERGVRFQAVAAANDRMAFGALDALQVRGVSVPDTIALTGFDDVRETASLGVPLTTVRQSFFDAGKDTVNLLVRRINGERVSHSNKIDTHLIVRWSCGCLPETVRQAVVGQKEVAQTSRLQNKHTAAVNAMLGVTGVSDTGEDAEVLSEMYGRMWEGLLACLQDNTKNDSFLKIFNETILLLQRLEKSPSVWNNVISTLRRHALGGINDPAVMLRAENLFQQTRMIAGELSQRAQAYRRLVLQDQEHLYQDFSYSMAPAMSFEEIGDAITKNFPAMGLRRWYVMFYSDVFSPSPTTSPPPGEYRLLFQYDDEKFAIPSKTTNLETGHLVPRGKTPKKRRYTSIVMPLSLARNRFGFMWVEMGSRDWDVYQRVRNLVSSALLRTMLAQQREQARMEVEGLLGEARERAAELAIARDAAEQVAKENEKLYEAEQFRRQEVEALARASRQLSSLEKLEKVPQQILDQLLTVIPFDRGAVFLENANRIPQVEAHLGFSKSAPVEELSYVVNGDDEEQDMYAAVAHMKESIQIGDVSGLKGWKQPDWAPKDRSWLGSPLFFQDKVLGMMVLLRKDAWAFTKDDTLLVTTFAVQAAIALENAKLYRELEDFNKTLERMVEDRVADLAKAHSTLAKLDKNKSTFIQVAAHELRTPMTVIKGYLGMFQSDKTVQENPLLSQAVDGVMQGTDRLHQIVNSMLDVARLENQVLKPRMEIIPIAPMFRLIQKSYQKDLEARDISLVLDESINDFPTFRGDSELLQKAFDNVIVNGIKFTPDGGSVTVRVASVSDPELGSCVEVQIQDTGIGIDEANHNIIFEKLYQLGDVQLHSSGRTTFKGGGPGLGLALAAGIIKAHSGKIWVESEGHNEEQYPGSTFFIRLPMLQEA